MKKFIENLKFKPTFLLSFFIYLVFMTLPAYAGVNQWTTNGPYGGYIGALAVSPNYTSDNTVYAGAPGGRVYKTTDGGANWTAMGTINTGYSVLALAVSPNYSTDNTLFAGINSIGIYKSTNGGSSWTQVLSSLDVRSLAISPNYATDQTILAGTSGGVYKSTNGGVSWTAVNSGISSTYYICYLAMSPNYANDQTVYVGGRFSGGVYKSTNGGSSWTAVNSGISDLSIYSITISPNFSTDQTVYTGTYFGVYKTTNGGSSWTAASSGMYDVNNLAMSPNYVADQTVYAGTGNGVYKTTNGGSSWAAVNSGVSTPLNIMSLAISTNYATDQTVFAGLMAGGVFKTTSGGSSWVAANTGISSASISSLAMSPSYSADNTVFVGSYNGGIYKTTDGGTSWTSVNSIIPNLSIYSLAISPNYAGDQTVFAGSWGGGVYKTTNGGANWSTINTGITNLFIDSLAISPNYTADQTVFAGAYYGNKVYKTTNGGASWTAVYTGTTGVIFSLAISPNYALDSTAYIGTSGSGIYKTTDGGASWYAVNSGIPSSIISLAISPNYATDQTVFAGTDGSIYKSTNSGSSWVSSGLGGTIHSIAVSPNYAADNMVFVGTGSGGPHGGGPSSGVYKSMNGGAIWTAMNSGLPTNLSDSSPTMSISPNYATDRTVFAGTRGFSVFIYTFPLICTDNDNDGYKIEGGACGPVDCNDNNASIHPGAAEICNGIDDNCNGQIDEGVQNTYSQDSDSDTYGNVSVTILACTAPSGYVSDNTDCNDSNASINPGAAEICNGVDDNCNGQTDEGVLNTYYQDSDGDLYGNASVSTQACTVLIGYTSDNADCNDSNAAINPGATEVCGNGVDDNCNNQIDEGCNLSADLSITNVDSPDPLTPAGQDVTYTITVTNNGPAYATAVIVTDVLDASLILVSATPSQGAPCAGAGTTTCNLGGIISGSSATVTVVATTSITPGMIGSTASVTATETDPNAANNIATQTTNVGDVSRQVGISTRGYVETGTNIMVGGFSFGGTVSKKVLIRGRGPSMSGAPYNFTGTLTNPTLEIYSGTTLFATVDDWQAGATMCNAPAVSCGTPSELQVALVDPCQPNVGQTTSPPGCMQEAALYITLPPGAYTVKLMGVNNEMGKGIIEVYDADTASLTMLGGISTRGKVLTGTDVMVGGFIVGAGSTNKTLLLRGRGPSMSGAPYNFTGTLSNPTLEVYSGQTLFATVDDWQSGSTMCNAPAISCGTPSQLQTALVDPCQPNVGQTTAPPGCTQEAAMFITLPPGAYTAKLKGVNNGTGIGIFEVYEMP